MMMITSVSITGPAQTVESHERITSSPHLQHMLVVDLNECHQLLYCWSSTTGRRTGDWSRAPEIKKAHPLLPGRLRAIVEHDCNRPEGSTVPRIDAVRLTGLTSISSPGWRIWRALDGLQPRHLELHCGEEELCEITPLDRLAATWPLESLVMSSACGVTMKSKYLQSITSLTLDLCCSLEFRFSNRPSALRVLTLVENDAISTFLWLRNKSHFADNIHTLKIQSTNGCDFSTSIRPIDVFKTLQNCNTLLSFDLTLFDKSYYLSRSILHKFIRRIPAHLPPNVENLHFRGPPSLAKDMSIWFRCAADPKWLPNLKTISFRLDAADDSLSGDDAKPSPPVETPKVVHQFLDTLCANRPSILVIR